MTSLDSECIPPNPDISGIGVRTAIYAQNLLSFAPAIFALLDRKVTPLELETLENQSTAILITAFAVLVSTIVQALTQGITNFHAAIILDLSWMNNTNLFIYFLLYVYHKVDLRLGLKKPTRDDVLDVHELAATGLDPDSNTYRHLWFQEIRIALKAPVFIIGSLHMSLMAAVGIWLWSHPATFGNSPDCALSAKLVILGRQVPLSSPGLRKWSLLVYSVLLVPGVNLALPIVLFGTPYMYFLMRVEPFDSTNWFPHFTSSFIGLSLLAILNIIFLVDTEVTLRANKPLLQSGDASWTFGQTLALLLLLVPLRDLVETLVEKRPKTLGKRLLDAARGGKLDAVESFLSMGADVHVKDSNGCTALYLAAERGHTKIVGRLLDHDADARATDKYGKTALHIVASQGHRGLVEYLTFKNADMNAKKTFGGTPLHEAVGRGDKDMVVSLADSGADLNVQSNVSGMTALHLAIRQRNFEIARYLAGKGAHVDVRGVRVTNFSILVLTSVQDNSGKTAIELAQEILPSDARRLLRYTDEDEE